MTNSNVVINEDKQYQDVYPTYSVNISLDNLTKFSFVRVEDEDDDLGDYKISHCLVNNIPVFLRKYNRYTNNEFTIWVDYFKCSENNEDIFNIAEQLIAALKLESSQIVWKNEELQSLKASEKI